MVAAACAGTAWIPWRPALAAVPRHRYLPDTVWIDKDGEDPAFLPLPEPTILTGGCSWRIATRPWSPRSTMAPTGPHLAGRLPTSSASSPVIVAVMLAALDTQPGQRVCEIGTGTGDNAALCFAQTSE